MQNHAMNWDDLRFVLAITRGASLSAAARRLRVDQTTVARRLASLERDTETKLFLRVQGRLVPTEAGETASAHAERMEAEMIALEAELTGADKAPEGTVRITSVPIVVNRLLAPQLGTLLRRHPKMTIELISESRNLSLTKREADIAVRLARPEAGAALCRRLATLAYSVYGPTEGSSEDQPWMTYAGDYGQLPQARWVAANGTASEDVQLLVDDAETLVQAVASGLGRAVLPDLVMKTESRLQRLSPDPVVTREAWLLVHPDTRHLPRIAAVVDWLQDVFDGLEGRTRPLPDRAN